LTDEDWQTFADWRTEQTDLKHLFLCVSVPMVYADFETLERILQKIPFDQTLEDDLRDHWRSVPHQVCRERLLKDQMPRHHYFRRRPRSRSWRS
jgi:hypothetical protein